MKKILCTILGCAVALSLCACDKDCKVDETVEMQETLASTGHREITKGRPGNVEITGPRETEKIVEKEIEIVPEYTKPLVEPQDADFVRVKDYIPTVFIDLRYATNNNFTNQTIYEFKDVWLRYGTVKKLMEVAAEVEQQGLYLKIWDGFRPVSAQFALWEVCPNPKYVANPNEGYSSHSRGNTVDLTLCNKDGYELWMPTEFDDFSKKADRDYSDCSADTSSNALILEEVMRAHGFDAYFNEWWHFSDSTTYDVETKFDPAKLG